MKLAVVILALAMTGCATVNDIEHTPATMSVMSGKSPKDYASCFVGRIADSRKPPQIEPRHAGLRVIVPQKLISSDPAAIVDIEPRSSGSSIKLFERMGNNPLRPKDVQHAVTACISGE
ncbi:hypothetical protein [Pseudomonas sp. NFR16]|uniref:hypothetical protein n=1 Tax=Pseudomonas sp. NFR16 TaxID=1566248 RepID=UPI0008BA215A|nr:hypothetical protein [Pseudomonas sp. NFR16]SEI64770.1 hypothetical protein SAMN03159495_1172 [Pseudomonas sp. NFR16]